MVLISENVQIALIVGIPPTITALAGLVVSVRNASRIEQIHKATNSMKDALVAVTRSDALQEGHSAGLREAKTKGEAE